MLNLPRIEIKMGDTDKKPESKIKRENGIKN